MADQFEIIRASPMDARRVLRMTLAVHGQSEADLEAHVTGFIQYARRMGFDLTHQWILFENGRPLTACACIESAGRTVMLFLPETRVHRSGPGAVAALLRHVMIELAGRDNRLAQCLIDPEDVQSRSCLAGAGFVEIAELHYMEQDVPAGLTLSGAAKPPDECNSALSWVTYDAMNHAAYRSLIEATYRESRDCPRLTGLRDTDDVIAGHKAAGIFESRRWLMAMDGSMLVGCILLGENPIHPALEVVYMGVHPARRGHGLGACLLGQAFALAHREGFAKLTLAVDAANTPAMALYR